MGVIAGSYAHCPYCDEKLHTDYRYPYETKEKNGWDIWLFKVKYYHCKIIKVYI